jgi:aspartate aminotransferase
MVHLAGGSPRILDTDEAAGFRLSPRALADAIGPRTRALVLNSPSNPTGAGYLEDDLAALAEVLRRHPELLVISDDIYRRIYFGGALAPALLQVAPDLQPRIILVSGCSKTFAMTGLRIGWIAAAPAIAEAINRVQGQTTSSPATPCQYGALAALEGDQGWVAEMTARFDQRRRRVIAALAAIPGVSCFDPRGAFYVFPNFEGLFGRRLPDGRALSHTDDLARYLLEAHHLVGVPGAPFGSPRHIRFSIAADEETLDRGMTLLAAAVRSL